ncbi:hypothetical protein Nepgr_004654 [Nepenthes gracilis]|uniref:Uncharacterized protein n=1 Tax=Nepenthes gracilis TaxID=150966 RepID=A0AAD3S1T0_NEPGR|nr:hypothetical protein Nepgr_004654 [Nepenthes gracilis]
MTSVEHATLGLVHGPQIVDCPQQLQQPVILDLHQDSMGIVASYKDGAVEARPEVKTIPTKEQEGSPSGLYYPFAFFGVGFALGQLIWPT